MAIFNCYVSSPEGKQSTSALLPYQQVTSHKAFADTSDRLNTAKDTSCVCWSEIYDYLIHF